MADCEERDDWFFAQDVNAWSSVAYVAVGLFIVLAGVRRGVPRAFVALGAATALEGVGSLLYHGSDGRAGQVLHDGALVAVLGFVAGWHVGRLAGAAARTALAGVGAGLAIGVVAGATSSLLTNVAAVVGVVVVVGAEVLARHRGLAPVWTLPLLVLAAAAVRRLVARNSRESGVLGGIVDPTARPVARALRGPRRRVDGARGGGPDRMRTVRIEGDFRRDGAVCVRDAVAPEHVELARRAIDANLADLSPLAKRASADEDGAFVEDFCNWQRLPEIERFIRESGVATIAAELMGATTVRLYHDHVLVKEPGTRQRTPWHQDQPYYNIDGRQNVSMWLPVDSVPRETTLEFVAGSHRGEWFMPRVVPRRRGEVVPRRHARRAPRHRGPAERVHDRRLGARAGRRRLLPHADVARRRRGRRHQPPARALRAVHR